LVQLIKFSLHPNTHILPNSEELIFFGKFIYILAFFYFNSDLIFLIEMQLMKNSDVKTLEDLYRYVDPSNRSMYKNQNTFVLFEIPNYGDKTIWNKLDRRCILMSVIEEKLKDTDRCYYELVYSHHTYKVFCDIDKLEFHKQTKKIDEIIKDIAEYWGVSVDDISYTQNNSVEGSYHVFIPSLICNGDIQKLLWEEFKQIYKYGDEIDKGIHIRGRMFRLPYQTKNKKIGTEHVIIKGKISDFIIYNKEGCKLFDSENRLEMNKKLLIPIFTSKPIKITSNYKGKTNDKYTELLFNVIGKVDYNEWLLIGSVLKSNGYDFEVFDNFRKEENNEGDARRTWDSIKKLNFSMYSLHKLAKKTNPEGYMNWLIQNKPLYLEPFTTGLIAQYYYDFYKQTRFIYNENFKKLYSYNGFRWVSEKADRGYLVTKFVNDELRIQLLDFLEEPKKHYTKLVNDMKLRIKQCNDQDEKDDLKHRLQILEIPLDLITEFEKNVEKMRDVGCRRRVIQDIVSWSTDNNILFDTNPHLYVFNNKIYDLKNQVFVEPNEKLYLSKTCGYDYDENYPKEYIEKLDGLLDTIFPDEQIKEYFLTALSTGLTGIHMQYAFINTGQGGNGKGLIDGLMLYTTGEYGYTLTPEVLLNKGKLGSCPEIANLNNKRFVVAQEPDAQRRIRTAILKSLTGDSIINARMNYSDDCECRLRLTLFLECNEIPKVDQVNQAVNRRFRINLFESEFLDYDQYELREDKTNVFLKNEEFASHEFKEKYKQALFEILITYLEKFYKLGRLPPQPVKCIKRCSELFAVSDNMFDWFRNTFIEDDQAEPLPFKTIYEQFKQSQYFNDLSKVDKRKYKQKTFYDEIMENHFLKNYIVKRNQMYRGKQLKINIVKNWRLREETDKDDENMYHEELLIDDKGHQYKIDDKGIKWILDDDEFVEEVPENI